MSRDEFISDNLYNMRERFKRNQSMSLPGAVQKSSDVPTEESVSSEIRSFSTKQNSSVVQKNPEVQSAPEAETAPQIPQKNSISAPRLPQIPTAKDNSEAARELRDLEGRLLRDLSFIEAEEEFLRQYSGNLTKFRTVIERLLDELSAQGTADARKINRFRIEYFQSRGRFDSVLSRQNGSSSTPQVPQSNSGRSSVWPLAAAIIAAGLTVSLTMLWLFGG